MKDTDDEEVEKQYNKSMFRKLYDGDYGLAKTFWSGFFIFNIGGVIFVTPSLIQDTNPTFVFAFIIIWIVNMFYWVLGTCSAAKKYTGSKVWSFLSLLYILLALLRIALYGLVSLNSPFSEGVEVVQSLVIVLDDGEKSNYRGQVKDGKPNGIGIQVFAGGNRYVGNQKDGKAHGKGIYTFANGDHFDGEFKEDLFHKGIYTFVDGSIYEGNFKNDKKDGKGVLTSANGDYFDGEFKEGLIHKGILTFANGDHFDGEFKEGLIHKGIYTSAPLHGMVIENIFIGGEIVATNLLRVYQEQDEKYDATLYR